jgi:hypothetical protein
MLAELVGPNHDTLDILLIVAMILFAVSAVLSFKAKAETSGIGYLGLVFLAFALLFVS